MTTTRTVLSLLVLGCLVAFAPTTYAAGGSYEIDQETLATESSKPTITGTSEEVSKIRLEVYKEDSSKRLFKSKEIRTKDDEWSVRITKKLSDGTYTVNVYGDKEKLGTETLVVGDDAGIGGTFSVNSIPLLAGGTTRAGMTAPVAYLQVRNSSAASTTITAFNMTQTGSADPSIVTTLEVVDDRGKTRWHTTGLPWTNKTAPAGLDYTLAPGEMRLYTVKAMLAPSAASQSGKTLTLDVSSVTSNGRLSASLPIRGTVWNIGL